jgi:hypothetical protein
MRGNACLRRFLANGAVSVLCSRRAKEDPWLDPWVLESQTKMI